GRQRHHAMQHRSSLEMVGYLGRRILPEVGMRARIVMGPYHLDPTPESRDRHFEVRTVGMWYSDRADPPLGRRRYSDRGRGDWIRATRVASRATPEDVAARWYLGFGSWDLGS